jgi:hypothetical protein
VASPDKYERHQGVSAASQQRVSPATVSSQ